MDIVDRQDQAGGLLILGLVHHPICGTFSRSNYVGLEHGHSLNHEVLYIFIYIIYRWWLCFDDQLISLKYLPDFFAIVNIKSLPQTKSWWNAFETPPRSLHATQQPGVVAPKKRPSAMWWSLGSSGCVWGAEWYPGARCPSSECQLITGHHLVSDLFKP